VLGCKRFSLVCVLKVDCPGHGSPIPTFEAEDAVANVAALERMISLAGTPERVIPGHDPLLFERFPGNHRVAVIVEE